MTIDTKEGLVMARPKKPTYEFVESKQLYRKRVKGHDGKYISLYGKTPQELSVKIEEFLEDLRVYEDNKENPFVCDYADYWIDLQEGHLTYGASVDYRSIINCHIKPSMEGLRMRDVRPDDIKRMMKGVAHFSRSVHDKTYMLAKQIFTNAFENGMIHENPCPKMHAGGREPEERQALTEEQIETLLNAVKGTRAYVFCMIGIYAGLRREEILGLKWDCVTLGGVPAISVKRACRFVHNRPVVEERLKTKASKRIVPIPPQLVECLTEAKKEAKSPFVIGNEDGTPLAESQFQRLWKYISVRTVGTKTYFRYANGKKTQFMFEAVKGEHAKHNPDVVYTIDFKVTPHILRHTYITNLLLGGVDIKTVQYLAGHERAKITLDIYAHLTYNRPEEIIDKINMAFAPQAEEG